MSVAVARAPRFIHHEKISRLKSLFFVHGSATTAIYTLSLHDALPISSSCQRGDGNASTFTTCWMFWSTAPLFTARSEEHTSELQSLRHLVCRLLLEKKKQVQRVRRQRRCIVLVELDHGTHKGARDSNS